MLKNYTLKVAVFFFISLIAACEESDQIVSIGAIYNLTGAQKNLDIPSSNGAILAVEKINGTGGILGQKVELILEDGETNLEIIADKTETMIRNYPDMPVIIGMSDTDVVLAAARVAGKNKKLFVTSGATSPLLPEQVPDYLFLACYGDNVQAAAAAEWAFDNRKARNVVVLYKADMSYTELLRKYFAERFKELGGDVVFNKGYTQNTFSTVLESAPAADLIFLSASPDEVVTNVKLIRDAGITVPILSGDGFDIGVGWAALPNEDNSFFTTHADVGPDSRSPEVIAFRKTFAEKFPNQEPDAFTALGYDTINLVAAAIEKAGSTEVEDVKIALSTLSNFQGVTGEISFNEGSAIPIKSVTLLKTDKGKEIFVQEILPSKVPSP
jgi:branched-chain amino acid transport system substrate-binding protein